MQQISSECFVQEHPQILMGISLPTRMTILKLTNNKMVLISPVRPSQESLKWLKDQGHIDSIIAPNAYHHLYFSDYYNVAPSARFFGVTALKKKRPDLKFTQFLGNSDSGEWNNEIQYIQLNSCKVQETVFYFPKNKLIVITDLAFNIRPKNLWEEIFWSLNNSKNKLMPSRFFLSSIKNKNLFKEEISKIMQWDFDKIILPHGELILSNGKEAFQKAFQKFMEKK